MKSVPAARHARRVAILLAALGALILATPATAHAEEETVGIAISPATKDGRDARSRFSYQLDPGQTASDRVWVANAGTKSLKVTIFATDAFNTDDGSYALLATEQKPVDAGSWVTFRGGKDRVEITLKPRQASVIPFTVVAPPNASPGDHPAGVVAAAAPVGAGQLAVERRIATRLYARVSGELQPALTLSGFSATYGTGWNPLTGAVTATAVLSNTGNVALGGTVSLDAKTWFGLGVGTPMDVELGEMLPGSSRSVTYQLLDVPQVGYAQPHMVLRSAIGPDAADPGPLPVIERETFVLAVPWTIVGLILIGLVVGQVLRLRRRRDEARAVEWVAYTEAEAERKAMEALSDATELVGGGGGSAADEGDSQWNTR